MTKIKNTKKGMAKKTLSVSLAVAMLATSNVPVWAAEFSDGADVAAFTSEAPVEVEAPVVDEAPVIDTVDAPVAKDTQVTSSSKYNFDGISVKTEKMNPCWTDMWAADNTSGDAFSTFLNDGSSIKTVNGEDITGTISDLKLVWKYGDSWDLGAAVDITGADFNNGGVAGFNQLQAKANAGKTLTMLILEQNTSGTYDIVKEISFGTIQKVDLNTVLTVNAASRNITYNGTDIKVEPTVSVKEGVSLSLPDDPFTWNYTSNTGEYVNANTQVTAVGTLKTEIPGYTTTVTAPAYTIAKRTLSADDIIVKVKNPGKDFTYANGVIEIDKSEVDVFLKDFSKTDNVASSISLNGYVKKVTVAAYSVGTGKRITVEFDSDLLKASANFNEAAPTDVTSTDCIETGTASDKTTVDVVALDLSTCEVTLKSPVQVAESATAEPENVDVVIKKNGQTLDLTKGSDYVITLAKGDYTKPGTYTNAITINGTGTNVTGANRATLVTVAQAFTDSASFLGTHASNYVTGNKDNLCRSYSWFTGLDYNNGSAVEFKNIFSTNGVLGLFSPDGRTAGDQSNYRVTYDNNVNATYVDGQSVSVAKLTVTAIAGDYKGCSKDFYFKINPAKVKFSDNKDETTVTTNATSEVPGVILNEKYSTASQYADAIGLKITGTNGLSGTDKIVSNTKADDYTVKYSFVNSVNSDDESGENVAGHYVKVEATLKKNGNFIVPSYYTPATSDAPMGTTEAPVETASAYAASASSDLKGVTGNTTEASDNHNGVVTLYVPILNKAIETLDISLKQNTFTFTGEVIKPEVVVKENGRVLEDGVKIVEIKNGLNAGTATIKVSVDGYTGTKELTATIAPANLSDVVFEIKKANVDAKTYTYDGRQQKPVIAKEDDKSTTDVDESIAEDEATADVKLDKVVISKMFDITYGENINAGEKAGTVTLTPKATYAKNFNGSSLTATFEIHKAVLEMKNTTSITEALELKDSTGKKIRITTDSPANSIEAAEDTLTWTSEGARFASAKITKGSFEAVKGLKPGLSVIEDDYELVYVNAEEATTSNAKAYVAIIGKGNFTGEYSIVKDKDGKVGVKKTSDVADANKAVPGTYTVLQDAVIKATATSYDIIGRTFYAKDVTVEDGTYAGGLTVKPVVTVKDSKTGAVLEEDKDYTINIKGTAINATTTPITFEVIGKGQYKGSNVTKTTSGKDLSYIINKKDLKDCFVDVTKRNDALDLTVMNGNVTEKTEKFDVKDNGDGTATVSVIDGGKNYTGSVTVDIVDPEKPGTVGKAMITDVEVVGNKATVVLSGDVDNASGYDYVIATEEDYQNGRVDIVKNQIKTTADFKYVQKGTYYAYCHAWTRGTDGKKVFGEWSNIYKFDVYATTPAQPVITSVKRSGSTVTVTYTQAANADGYDVVLGTKTAVVNGEKRPINYGTLVKKNIKGDTVTVTFKNVPAGKYYAGLHAWNRTSLDNKKVFSPWSNIKTVTVK